MARVQGPKAVAIIGKVFLALGLVGLLVAGGLTVYEMRRGLDGHADGVVTGYGWGPTVRFTAEDGSQHQFTSAVRSTIWHVGDHVPVAYVPAAPNTAEIDRFAGRWFEAGLAGILASVFALVGCGLWLGGPALHGRALR